MSSNNPNENEDKIIEKQKKIEQLKKIIEKIVQKTKNLENQIKEQKLKIDTLEKEKSELEKKYIDAQNYNEILEKNLSEKYEKVLKENLEKVHNSLNKKLEDFKMVKENKIENMRININRNIDNIDNIDNINNLNNSNNINIPQNVTISNSKEIRNKDEIFNNNKIYNNNKVINNNKHINNREFVTYERTVYNNGQNIDNNSMNRNNNNFNNINNNNNIIYNNINNFYNNDMSKDFKYNSNKINKLSKNENYSFECTDEKSLQAVIIDGTDKVEIIISLKNTGQQTWQKGMAKLIFTSSNFEKNDNIMLDTQKPGETKKYRVLFKNLSQYPEGDYFSILNLNINGQNIGNPIEIKVTIKESNQEVMKNKKVITTFKNEYNLINSTEEDLLKVLKKNNFDFNKSFQYIINN